MDEDAPASWFHSHLSSSANQATLLPIDRSSFSQAGCINTARPAFFEKEVSDFTLDGRCIKLEAMSAGPEASRFTVSLVDTSGITV